MGIKLFCFDILLFSHYMNFLISRQLYVFSYNIVTLNIISQPAWYGESSSSCNGCSIRIPYAVVYLRWPWPLSAQFAQDSDALLNGDAPGLL